MRKILTLFVSVLSVLATMSDIQAQTRPVLTVGQGEIGKWDCDNCTHCAMHGMMWGAVDGQCYYPVDMAKKPGIYEIGKVENGRMKLGWLKVATKEYELEEIDFPKEEYVNLSKEDARRHWKEQSIIKPVLRRCAGKPQFSIPSGKPAKNMPSRGGDNFAVHRTFNGVKKNRHTGIDYPIGTGNDVLSIGGGTVALTGDHFFAGQSVYVDHGNGLITMYFHLSDIAVKEGEQVEKGQSLGKIGSTGRSTGPHLHIGARWLNQRVDPNWLMGDPKQLPNIK